jgi:hypothetical protein
MVVPRYDEHAAEQPAMVRNSALSSSVMYNSPVPSSYPLTPQMSSAGGDGFVTQVVWADTSAMSNRKIIVKILKKAMAKGF